MDSIFYVLKTYRKYFPFYSIYGIVLDLLHSARKKVLKSLYKNAE